MEYLVPALAVLAIGVLTLAVGNRMARSAHSGRTAAPASTQRAEASEARAREAVSLLDEGGHRAVYGHIAQSRVMEAIRAYRGITGRSLKDAVLDVQSLAAYPQVYPTRPPAGLEDIDGPDASTPSAGGDEPVVPEPAPQERGGTQRGGAPRRVGETEGPDEAGGGAGSHAAAPGAESGAPREADGSADAVPAPAEASAGAEPLTIPTEWMGDPAPEEQPFEVEVLRGEGSVRVSSRDLPPWLRDQLAAMVRDGNLESAAVQLSTHSELTVPEAFELLRRMRERREGHGA